MLLIMLQLPQMVMDASMLSSPVRNTSLNRFGHLYMPQTHQEVDMAGAHYELIRRYVNSQQSSAHLRLLRATLADIWGRRRLC